MTRISLESAWSGEADCKNCALRNSVLFAGLQESDFGVIHTPIDQYILPPGALLYRFGEPGEAVFTVRHGLLKLVRYTSDGNQRIVRLVRTTDAIGLGALLNARYRHDAVVLHETEVCRIPTEVIRALSRQNPGLHEALMQRWERSLNEAEDFLVGLSTGAAKQRVAHLLLWIADQDQAECELFSREDMGALLGITTETASRIIAEFRRQGLLEQTGLNRYRCDRNGLHGIAGE